MKISLKPTGAVCSTAEVVKMAAFFCWMAGYLHKKLENQTQKNPFMLRLSRESKGGHLVRNLIIGCVIFLGLILILPWFFGISISIVFSVFEWITKFVLPWVFLYWLIRMVRTLEKKG